MFFLYFLATPIILSSWVIMAIVAEHAGVVCTINAQLPAALRKCGPSGSAQVSAEQRVDTVKN